jgi:hypothetical protein
MIAASYGSVSDIEVVWTMIATIGLVYAALNLRSAFLDMRALGGFRNGRYVIATTSVKLELTRIIIQSVFATIGIFAMTLPDVPQDSLPTKLVIFGAIFRWGLIICAVCVAYQSFVNHQVRKALLTPQDAIEQNRAAVSGERARVQKKHDASELERLTVDEQRRNEDEAVDS